MTSGKLERAELPLVPSTASSAMQRFWAEFRARTAAAYTLLRPAALREPNTSDQPLTAQNPSMARGALSASELQ